MWRGWLRSVLTQVLALLQFTATGLSSDGTTKNLTNSVTWSSSEGLLASVSNAAGAQGLATGLLSEVLNHHRHLPEHAHPRHRRAHRAPGRASPTPGVIVTPQPAADPGPRARGRRTPQS